MGKQAFDRETRRGEIMAESLEHACEPKFGFFGYTSPLAVGETSLAPMTSKFTDFKRPGFLLNPPKKGMTVDTLFEFITPTCIGDPYQGPKLGGAGRGGKQVGEFPFKPPGHMQFGLSKGIDYQMSGEGDGSRHARMRQKVEVNIKPQITSTVTKKGGGGVYTPGVLFGFEHPDGSSRMAVPEFIPDDYGIAAKLAKEERQAIEAKKMHEVGFKGCGYGNGIFSTNVELYHCEQPYGIPREIKKFAPKGRVHHEVAMKLGQGIKTGHDACMSPFPEWQPDPIPMPRKRIHKGDDAVTAPAWYVGAPVVIDTPMPPVQMITRNLRREFPKSFIRPKVM